MDAISIIVLTLIIELGLFILLMIVGSFLIEKLKTHNIKVLNPKEYFPEEELHNLRQMFFLIMMGLCFTNILYSLVFVNDDQFYLAIFDIIISLYIAINLDKSSLKNKIILILLVPYGSITFTVFGHTLVNIIDLIHIPIFMYFMMVYYEKFREYTKSNGLGIAVISLVF